MTSFDYALSVAFLVGIAGGLVLASVICQIAYKCGLYVNLAGHAAALATQARLHAEIAVNEKRLAESQRRLNRFFTAVLDEEETTVAK